MLGWNCYGVDHLWREIQHTLSAVACNSLCTTRQVLSFLEPEEIAEAERLWIIQSQSKLMEDKQFDLWKKQFGVFLD